MSFTAFTQSIVDLAVLNPLPGAVLAIITLFGVVKLGNLFGSYLAVLLDTLVRRGTPLTTYGSKAGAWAVVTGATAGIGEQFAHQLARAGFKVLLVSRTQSKLDAVASELKEKYSGEVATFTLDAASAGDKEYSQLAAFVDDLEGGVGVLVNNVGQSHEIPVPFAETTKEEMHQIIQINNVATLEITRAVIPALQKSIKTKKSKRALILTMGSFAGLTPTPLLATYSGSKAFLQGWSSALGAELAPEGIDVELVVSYLVTSNMSKIRRTSAMIPSPKAFVKATLRSLNRRGGAQERAYTSTPFWSHGLLHWSIENALGVYSRIVAVFNRKMHVDIRRRALRKKAKSANTQ